MKTRRFLVTGGAGFIGSHLSERLLDAGSDVVVLDNFDTFYDPAIKRANVERVASSPAYRLVEGDIRDEDVLEELFTGPRFDAVFHLAARAGVTCAHRRLRSSCGAGSRSSPPATQRRSDRTGKSNRAPAKRAATQKKYCVGKST